MSADSAEATATAAPDQGWHWPTRELLLAFLRYAVLIQLLWIVIYGGCSWLTAQHTRRVPLATPWDARIPFVPAAAAVYLSLFPLIWLSLFILPTAEQIKQFAKALAWLYIISGIGFVILPGAQPNPPPPIEGWTRTAYEFADWINLDYNLCPSLHVGMAVLCAYAYSRRSHPLASTAFWLWAAAISASTLLLRQHYLIDVAAGAVLGYVVAKHVIHPSWRSFSPSETVPSTIPDAAAAPAPRQ